MSRLLCSKTANLEGGFLKRSLKTGVFCIWYTLLKLKILGNEKMSKHFNFSLPKASRLKRVYVMQI